MAQPSIHPSIRVRHPTWEGDTAAQIAITTVNYQAAKDEWDIYNAMEANLMTQIIECVDDKYYGSLIDRTEGITHSLFDILTHLRARQVIILVQPVDPRESHPTRKL